MLKKNLHVHVIVPRALTFHDSLIKETECSISVAIISVVVLDQSKLHETVNAERTA